MTANTYRLFPWNEHKPNPAGRFVLYWMQIQRRLQYNFALDCAVEWANKLGRPLLIFEGLRCDYPWASDRLHAFILQGMSETARECRESSRNYYPYVERQAGGGRGLLRALAGESCLVITDHFPAFVVRDHNQRIGPSLPVPYVSVDSGGIIPLGLSVKAPSSAYEFRRLMQKHFVECFTQGPKKNPLPALKNKERISLNSWSRRWKPAVLDDIPGLVAALPVDHSVPALELSGTRAAALLRMRRFVKSDLTDYLELHNHPDLGKTSGLSPYLHFGKISAHEVVAAVLEAQPEGWSLDRVHYNKGSREGFFNGHPSVDAFLDQAITWREVGYHHCRHVPNYDRYESLPEWARRSLDKHAGDRREYVYTLGQFERARTHDPLWNAAQTQLVREGVIHNYLRMLWGKKILEWTAGPREALDVMVELNNKYAIDGRNPNSYTGIFWTLGRFDRPWAPEREIFGVIRYMSSANTARKVRVKEYLRKYS